MGSPFRRFVVVIVLVGIVGYAGWSVLQAVENNRTWLNNGCLVSMTNLVSIDESGKPLICINRLPRY